MKAIFKMDAAHMEAMIDRMNRRAGTVAAVTVSGDETITEVKGETQSVMFVIGFVADHGEDCLLSAG